MDGQDMDPSNPLEYGLRRPARQRSTYTIPTTNQGMLIMPSLEEQFESAFTEITLEDNGKHLLDMEAVTECVVAGESVTITLDLPKDDALRSSVSAQVEERIKQISGISEVNVRMSDQPPPTLEPAPQASGAPDGAQPRAAQRPQSATYLSNYDTVIAVASGKGGVGKSTVAVNLALALKALGHKVSLFDSDIYGPSIPIMMGLRNTQPTVNEDGTIIPLKKYGIDLMSLGNLVEEAAATIWRGPIVHQVIDQMLRDTQWPGGDFMIVDLPPGTGDAQLSLSQLLTITGAVIVSTPQDVALLDAFKAVGMFQKVDVPVIGMVENMSTFACPSCGTETHIFDKDNAKRMSSQNNIPFLGTIPIEVGVREGGDLGKPIMTLEGETPSTKAFMEIANNLLDGLEYGN